MPLKVRFRPDTPYLGSLAGFALAAALGLILVNGDNTVGTIATDGSGLVALVLALPLVLSTVLRIPVLTVDDKGIRLPHMRLTWPHIARLTETVGPRRRPVLLIVPADPAAALRLMNPLQRMQYQVVSAQYGTPFVVADRWLDATLGEIQAAAARLRPAQPAPPAAGRSGRRAARLVGLIALLVVLVPVTLMIGACALFFLLGPIFDPDEVPFDLSPILTFLALTAGAVFCVYRVVRSLRR
ncbi:hypothetical protein ACQP2X_23205 [Actinoplanes sp. CA-131856]